MTSHFLEMLHKSSLKILISLPLNSHPSLLPTIFLFIFSLWNSFIYSFWVMRIAKSLFLFCHFSVSLKLLPNSFKKMKKDWKEDFLSSQWVKTLHSPGPGFNHGQGTVPQTATKSFVLQLRPSTAKNKEDKKGWKGKNLYKHNSNYLCWLRFIHHLICIFKYTFPHNSVCKESALWEPRFDPLIRKVPWGRKWQLLQYSCKSGRWKSLAYPVCGLQEPDTTERLSTRVRICIYA